MKGIIELLPEHIANQIAAGEVVQRPASVIKELIENSIDAGANSIKVFIKDAGKTLIQVIDNGCGMSQTDALLCFKRHATSKIKTVDDIYSLNTKGFRGEALASISAISHVVLKTKRNKDATGFKVLLEAGKPTLKEEFAGVNGTTVEVKNLFFNVPARRNFLKSDTVEFKHIQEEFERVVLTHPDLSFSLSHNGKEIYNLFPSNLRKRIIGILGNSKNEKLVPIEESTEIVSIKGFVVKPDFCKKTRGEQYFFVNDRFFKDSYFHHAVNKAFEGLLSPKHIPGYFLYFEIDPAKIDVNVHPNKTEIRFEEGKFIYSILLSSIRQSLGKYNISPSLDFDQETAFDVPFELRGTTPVEPKIIVDPNYNPFQDSGNTQKGNRSASSTPAIKAQGFGENMPTPQDWDAFYEKEENENDDPTIDFGELDAGIDSAFVLDNRYLIFPCVKGIMMLDIKRAKQRVLYDELMAKYISSPIASQELLFPFEKELSKNEIESWLENQKLIERLGFRFGIKEQILQVYATPDYVVDEIIYECVDYLTEQMAYQNVDKGELVHFLILSVVKSVSNTSIKITKEQGEIVYNKWLNCTENAFSPSGKKIINVLQTEEISKLI